jgi:precorrin-6B methylase 2
VEIGGKDTMDGVISVVMENLKEGGNAVVSFVRFEERR